MKQICPNYFRWTVALVSISFIILVVALRVQTYHRIHEQSEKLTLKHLSAAAYSASTLVDGDLVESLHCDYPLRDAITSNEQDSRYLVLHQQLAELAQEFATSSPIYLHVPAQEGDKMELTVTSAPEPYFRHKADAVSRRGGFSFGESGQLSSYEDEHGRWLSAFAPITNREGATVAMVQVDENFDDFLTNARAKALEGVWWNVLLLIALAGLLIKFFTQVFAQEQWDKAQLMQAVKTERALIHQLREHQAELASKSRQLEQSNRDLTDFANIASHDLKSPLRGIGNFAQLIARRHRNTFDQSSNEYLDFIIDNSKRAISLVDGLLAYSRSDGSSNSLTRFTLTKSAQSAVSSLQAVIEDRRASVDIADLPTVFGDEIILSQLFQNLIANGLKYNRSQLPRVEINCQIEHGEHVYSVRDNGIGIPAESQAQVFEMFRRLHGASEFEGSGIGLAFCSRIVAKYGGRIWLESAEGQGTTFYFTLPQALVISQEVLETA